MDLSDPYPFVGILKALVIMQLLWCSATFAHTMGHILRLLGNEFRLDMRQRYALAGILLYVASAIYVCYLSFQSLEAIKTWNALFWIILSFTAFNAVGKSFQRENAGQYLWLYTLVDARHLLLARTLYNAIIMLLLTVLSLFFYWLFLGGAALEQANIVLFALTVLMGGLGFAAVLTMVSAIASRTNNNIGIMAILGFPVLLPFLLVLVRSSEQALRGALWIEMAKPIGLLALISVLISALSYLLFPYLWRD